MAVMVPRESWTDQRLDDLSNRVDEGFRELRAEIASVRGEIGSVRGEIASVRGEVSELRAELGQVREGLGEIRAEMKGLEKKFDAKFDAMNRTLQIGFGLIGAVLTGILGLIAAQLATQA